jgi:hypothetical protein
MVALWVAIADVRTNVCGRMFTYDLWSGALALASTDNRNEAQKAPGGQH